MGWAHKLKVDGLYRCRIWESYRGRLDVPVAFAILQEKGWFTDDGGGHAWHAGDDHDVRSQGGTGFLWCWQPRGSSEGGFAGVAKS